MIMWPLILLLLASATSSASASACVASDVLWMWKGALTSHSISFKFGLREGHSCHDAAFALYIFPELQGEERPHSWLAMCSTVDGDETVKQCVVDELPHADRLYRYELSLVQGAEIVRSGSFRTPVDDGHAYNFRVALSSCADEDSDPFVFHEIKAHRPLFFLHMGDLHYHNLVVNDVTRFRQAYNSMFASPAGRAMLEMDLPFAYMWDDHDYGPDNSDKTAPGRNASVQAYREFVPHYELPGDDPLSAIYQAFTIGRVRFILTDLRSERTPNTAPDVPSKTVLGAKQKMWFKQELVRATQDPDIKLIVWCSTMPWNDDERKWGHFTYEQRELVNYIKGQGLNTWVPIVIVSGDAHMLAIDDGSHSPGNLVTLHAAALGRPGSVKGGPYSHGAFPGSGQYGLLDVTDDGKRVCLYFRGMRMHEGALLEYDTCHPETTPAVHTYYPPPIPVRVLLRVWKKAKKHVFTGGVLVLVAAIVLYLVRQRSSKSDKKRR